MVITPLHDQNTLRFIPYQLVTFGLIAVNVLVFLYQSLLDQTGFIALAYSAGMTPMSLLDPAFIEAPLPAGWDYLPPWATLFSHMFLHGDWLHLAGNMLFLWVFGDNVEDAMGHGRFLVFYLLCGVAAGFAHAMGEPGSQLPLIGASGAIAGLIGAYLMLHPRVQVWVLVLFRIPLRLPAYLVLIGWFAFQVFMVVIADTGPTAWWAHIGGFVAGVVLVALFKRPDVPLFGRAGS